MHKIPDEFDNEWNLPITSGDTGSERLKIAVLNLVRSIQTWFLNQSAPVAQSIYKHKIWNEFDNGQNPYSNMEVIFPWMMEICVFNPVSATEITFLNQSELKVTTSI